FYVSESGYLAPATAHEVGKSASQVIYSNVTEIIEHQRYVFDSFWNKAVPANQKIREIEEGIEAEFFEVISDAGKAADIYVNLAKSVKKQAFLVLPNSRAMVRDKRLGVLDYLVEASYKIKASQGFTSEMDSREEKDAIKIICPLDEKNREIVKWISDKAPRIKILRSSIKSSSTIFLVDNQKFFRAELRENKEEEEDFTSAIGLALYSNSKASITSFESIFDLLWNSQIVNEKLETGVLKQEEMRKELESINKELSVINKYKDDFVMRISSESATILTDAKVLTEVLLETKDLGSLTNMQYTLVKVIYENIAKINLLVKDLLDIYKLDRGDLRLSKAHVNIANLIAQTLSEEGLSKLILENNIQIDQDTSMLAPTETVYCDPERLQQVLSNLLRNAIEFVPVDGRGRITIRVEKQRQKQDRVDREGNKKTQEITFTIEDNGIAVTKDEVRRLYQKFYLIDTKNAFTKRQKATTLGLSVSRGIIEAHGGRIWIDETYKRGASFKFTLPIAK
ncbi:MAG TPA: HAMP domain-containing sensor histidine kinase, partial [Nitrososphaeraceae archaeon]|nr:HAMP domain-containing sensor histidine kinase [Nitrososphaeraceae archaeon]